jgi:predicted nucleic acid-binding protein
MYFFDSYALFEIYEGNPAYDAFFNHQITTSALNVGEFYYGLLKRTNSSRAGLITEAFDPDILEIDLNTVKRAMEFRFRHIKKKFSTVDCIGYQLALVHNLKFLTGDKEFDGLPGVEFVK